MLHEQQEESALGTRWRVYFSCVTSINQDQEQEALKKSVMLAPASQTSRVMQNVHDKPRLYFQTQTYLQCIARQGEVRVAERHVRGPVGGNFEARNGKGNHDGG